MSLTATLRASFFGIAAEEASFVRRGFTAVTLAGQQRLEQVGRAFIAGYNTALAAPNPIELAEVLGEQPAELRGFSFEGAAMGLALIDWLTYSRLRRWRDLAAGYGASHIYMLHVGAGWAGARLPWIRRDFERHLAAFDPLLRSLVLDGYGFHEGYFRPHKYLVEHVRPRLSVAGQRVFDQGLGRSLWFVCGADVEKIAERVEAFDSNRHSDLWSGVGLACAYAGGASQEAIGQLAAACGEHLSAVAQGAAFAAKTRERAGNLTAHTELATHILCGTAAHLAAAVTDKCLHQLPPDGERTAYETWRQRIQTHYRGAPVGAAAASAMMT